MKTSLFTLTLSLSLVAISAFADKAGYQSVIGGQSPFYANHFDNSSLAPSTGTGTFTATAGATFAADAWGNANSAVQFAGSTDQLSTPTAGNIISGANTTTAIGSMSMLFHIPKTWGTPTGGTNNMTIFSDSDTTNPLFSMNTLGNSGGIQFKATSKTIGMTGVYLAQDTWYYVAFTWDLTVPNTTDVAMNWYIGAMGSGALNSGSVLKSGLSSSQALGNAGPFVLSGKQPPNSGTGFQISGNPGAVDELAGWNTVLTAQNISDQFAATVVPEPTTLGLLGAGWLLFAGSRRIRSILSR